MKTLWTRMMATLLCLVMLCIAPAAMAEWTTLEVDFRGLIAQAGGQWQMESLSGSFSVWQDGREVGVLTADGEASNLVTLESTANVLLVPQMPTMPQGYLIQETGYSASITAGRLNTAMVMAYADAGMFTLQAEGKSAFTLTNGLGEEVLSFTMPAEGVFNLPEAIPAGEYTVHQTAGDDLWPDFTLTIPAYRGFADQLVQVDEAYALANALATPEPTEEPTPEPTEEPTPEPT